MNAEYVLNSPIFAHVASQDLAKLAALFARAYVRFSSRENFQNELDDPGEVEASCAGMKSEANGTHATEAKR